jgi:NAD(P)-dependent dehydrogenase (short-subunit alcohol dehydrogenase family)
MDLELAATRALVLGSSSGLGRAIAARLAAEGSRVMVSGRDEGRLRQCSREIGAAGWVVGDLAAVDVAAKVVDEAAQRLGGLDIIVINTGGGSPGALGRSTAQSREQAYRSMLRPALDAATAASPHLRTRGRGRMLFITARSIVEPSSELALSAVFRSGVAAAARSLALELAPDVLVNVVVPGRFDTPAYHRFRTWLASEQNTSDAAVTERHLEAVPMARLGRADELADVVTFLCSARASYVTGSVIRVDGGAVG